MRGRTAVRRWCIVKILYEISLPKEQDADEFEAFMKDRYFPAVHKGPTRVGQVTDLALWRGLGETNEPNHTFFVHMGYSGYAAVGLILDDDEVQKAFDAFGATLDRLGAFDRRAVWPKQSND
jgi:hypothetical protein